MPKQSRERTRASFAHVPDNERERAAQFFEETRGVFQIQVKDDLGVRCGLEAMAARSLWQCPQFRTCRPAAAANPRRTVTLAFLKAHG